MSRAIKIVFLAGALLFMSTAGYQRNLTIWKEKKHVGVNQSIIHEIGECINFESNWRDNISAISSYDDCVEMYTETDCDGYVTFMLPGSPSHDDLSLLKINNNIKSFKSCVLDEDSENCCSNRNAVDVTKEPEYAFWHYFFGSLGTFQQLFEERVKEEGRFISWIFLLGSSAPRNKGDQYHNVLEYAKQTIDADRCTELGSSTFKGDQLDQLKKLAQKVLYYRMRKINCLTKNWYCEKYVIHRQILLLWNEILESTNLAIELIKQGGCYEKDRDV